MNLKPLGDRVLVEVTEPEETSVSGIVIPDTARETPQRGRVLAVGPGRWDHGQRIPPVVQVGDEVVYSTFGGTEVTIEGENYLILRESDVLARYDRAAVPA